MSASTMSTSTLFPLISTSTSNLLLNSDLFQRHVASLLNAGHGLLIAASSRLRVHLLRLLVHGGLLYDDNTGLLTVHNGGSGHALGELTDQLSLLGIGHDAAVEVVADKNTDAKACGRLGHQL